MTINKTYFRKVTTPASFRPFVCDDKLLVKTTLVYCGEGYGVVEIECDTETMQQFYNYKPYIGCFSNHLSVIGDHGDSLAHYETFSPSHSLYS